MSGAGNLFTAVNFKELGDFPEYKLAQLAEILCGNTHQSPNMTTEGLLIVKNSDKYDFECLFYNPDGSQGMMCGNGGRCAVKFAKDLNFFTKKSDIKFFMAGDSYWAEIDANGLITVKMPKFKMIKKDIALIINNEEIKGDYIDVGSDHFVVNTNNIENLDILNVGKEIRHHSEFQPKGTNANFYQAFPNYIKMRTFERGVEKETGACGTGTISSAWSYYTKHKPNLPIKVIPTSGEALFVNFNFDSEGELLSFLLTGTAVYIGEKEIVINKGNQI